MSRLGLDSDLGLVAVEAVDRIQMAGLRDADLATNCASGLERTSARYAAKDRLEP